MLTSLAWVLPLLLLGLLIILAGVIGMVRSDR